MTETEQDIPRRDEVYFAGDRAAVKITVRTDNGPKDLSESDVRFALSRFPGDKPLIEKSLGDGVDIVDASGGVVRVTVLSEDTADLGGESGETYHYELRVRDEGATVSTVTVGEWTIHSTTTSFN